MNIVTGKISRIVILFVLGVSVAFSVHAAAMKWSPPKTEYGQPDLQGLWDYGTQTPFTRPKGLGEKRAYTEDEALAIEKKMRAENLKTDAPLDLSRGAPKAGDSIGLEADFNFMVRRSDLIRVNGEYRTSIIIDPPDGRLPIRKGFTDYFAQASARGLKTYDGPDTMDSGTRCLSVLPVPSIYPMPWNANLQIVQTKDRVMLFTEMNHDARIVRLHSAHLGGKMRFWMGDSIGHFEGNTLVVHTVDFRPEQSYAFLMPMSADMELTERFTRVSENEVIYSFTAVDLKAYTRPFTGERTLKRMQPSGRILEYACHEGNYALEGILAGTRKQEFDAGESGKPKNLEAQTQNKDSAK